MFRISNNLVGLLNLVTFLLSIPILAAGIWLSRHGTTECEKFLNVPVIVIGTFLMLVSLAGLIGACCRVSWLLGIYLLVMFLLMVLVFVFTIFASAVTNKGGGEALCERGYKEYKLGDYSKWLQKRVSSTKNWNKIKSCLVDGKVCSDFANKYLNDTVTQFHQEHLSALQSGCCKPSDSCNFVYVSPTVWNKPETTNYTNTDCDLWENDPSILCFNCQSCKAGFLDNIKSDWKKVTMVNIIFHIFLVMVYSIGCCAYRNNREDSEENACYPRKKRGDDVD